MGSGSHIALKLLRTIPLAERTGAPQRDNDVEAEEARVAMQDPGQEAIQVQHARKTYGFLKAVDDVRCRGS